jgi:orotate phosphoribosyltransferase
MKNYQHDFIEFAVLRNTLRFGEFTLKSGRISPYFFNAGLFNKGEDLRKLGQFYAAAIENSGIDYEVIFGPAYKGIPLVTTTSVALCDYGKNVDYAFNRKEAKDHGDGGVTVGANLADKNVLIVDDVITAGTAIRESVEVLKQANAKLVGVVVALDRQERGQGATSAIQEIEELYNIPVISIVKFEHLISYIQAEQQDDILQKMRAYRKQYGV